MIQEIHCSFMAKSLVGAEDTESKTKIFEGAFKKKIQAEYPSAIFDMHICTDGNGVEQYISVVPEYIGRDFEIAAKEEEEARKSIKLFVEEILNSQNINSKLNWLE